MKYDLSLSIEVKKTRVAHISEAKRVNATYTKYI